MISNILNDQGVFNLFDLLPNFLFGFLFLYLTYIAYERYILTKSLKTKQDLGKIFYLLCLICIIIFTVKAFILSLVSFLYYWIDQNNPKFANFYQAAFYSTDYIIFIIFSILFFQSIFVHIFSHLETDLHELLRIQKFFKSFLIIISSVEILIFFVLFTLYIIEKLDSIIFLLINTINTAILPISFLIAQIIFYFKKSGLPYKSLQIGKYNKKVKKTLFFWILSRIIHVCYFIFIISIFNDNTSFWINDKNELKTYSVCLYVLIRSIDEFICNFFAFYQLFNKKFILSFFSVDMNDFKKNSILQKKLLNDTYLIKDDDSDCNSNDKGINNMESSLILNDFKIMKEILTSNKSIGKLFIVHCNNNENKFLIREIKADISAYILEEISTEINYLKFYKLLKISTGPISYNYDEKSHILSILYLEFTSLKNLLHENNTKPVLPGSNIIDETKLPLNLKKRIMNELADCIEILHNHKIYHGHLTPNNIFLDQNFNVRIGDIGFNSLKKYCGFAKGYRNKNFYSPPEVLISNEGVTNPNEKIDIYSYGIILWEIFSEKIAFSHINDLTLLKNVVAIEENRPKIPQNLDDKFKDIIRACWQQNPEKRPSMKKIKEILNNN